MDPDLIRSFLDIGVAGLLVVAIVGGFRGWYVWRWVWEAKVKECEEWRALALRSLDTTERGVAVAERVVKAEKP